MLSQELEFSLNAAFQSAREKRHEYITEKAEAINSRLQQLKTKY